MNQLIYYLAFAGAVLLFLFGGPMLDMLGWSYGTAAGGVVFKLHPSTYLFVFAALLGLSTTRRRYWSLFVTPWYVPFFVASLVATARAFFIARSGGNGGELSGAIVSFVTPALMLISLQLDRADLNRIGMGLRIFFVVNSVMALAERAIGHRFIPTFMDMISSEHRAAALLGHPLSAALLTGLLIVNLMTAPKRNTPPWLRYAEIGIHVLAMFAYGGRSAIIFLPFALIASALFSRNSAEGRVSAAQRLAPLLLVAGGVLVMLLPIPFVEATLQRFIEDNGSANTRTAAIDLVAALDTQSLLFGVNTYARQTLLDFYNTPYGIELCWLGLTVIYGLLVTLLLAVSLPLFLLGLSRRLDRSAKYMVLYFLVVTAGSVGFSTKSLIMSDLLVMMMALAQTRGGAARDWLSGGLGADAGTGRPAATVRAET